MLPCKNIVKLLSSHEELSWMRRAEVKMHLFMCKYCSAYAKHLRMMKHGFKKLFSTITRVDPADVQKLEKEVIDKVSKAGNS